MIWWWFCCSCLLKKFMFSYLRFNFWKHNLTTEFSVLNFGLERKLQSPKHKFLEHEVMSLSFSKFPSLKSIFHSEHHFTINKNPSFNSISLLPRPFPLSRDMKFPRERKKSRPVSLFEVQNERYENSPPLKTGSFCLSLSLSPVNLLKSAPSKKSSLYICFCLFFNLFLYS